MRDYLTCAMHEEVIANIRERIMQIRKVMALAHDPRMIEVLQEVIASGEADIKRLEAERDQLAKQKMPPPNQH
jgi:predicted  nucleic acid-binding Zn-ribbon protein